MTTSKKPSAFAVAATGKPVEPPKPHPFTPQLVRQAAATPPSLPKDAKVTAFATRLPPDMQRMVKLACVERGIRMQDAVYEALWQWLNPGK
ncbi:hypothetical protein BS297_11200 [Rhodococcus erythropolis]|uniref:Uncharacterized protein n=1 Tax=Rhodococcus erythropolis TaxID=1833 RepID=A0A5N5E7N7_RHOER|nr:hypothetical protein BS297_11200 [Rhodococcus erythropolis]